MDKRTSKENYYLDIADAVFAALYLPEKNVRRDNRAQR